LAQDYPNFEIIVADDCSTDGSQEMLLEYESKYGERFVVRLAEVNRGVTLNSNIAHFSCSGKYIAWMGGDDLMLPGKLTRQVSFMEENPTCSICYHNLDVFDSETNSTIRSFNESKKINGDIRASIRFGTFNGASSTLVRADQTPRGGFDISLPVASDWLYWVETLGNGGTINYIDQTLGRYRRHGNNITRDEPFLTQSELDHLVSCQIILSKFPHYFADVISVYSERLIDYRHKIDYFGCLRASICLRPSFRAIVGLGVFLLSFGKIRL